MSKKPTRKTTALARRPAPRPPRDRQSLAIARRVVALEQQQTREQERLLPDLPAFSIQELKLTEQEETALAEPVKVDEMLIKPDGTPYLPHASYTRWFNRAFGRLGWAIVECEKPLRAEDIIVCGYLLKVHGVAVAFARGEQEYYPNNRRQTYGDALESTVASALRRCAKRLGVGLELWDKAFLETFRREQCVRVKVKQRDGSYGDQWRRRIDPALPGEVDTPPAPAKGTRRVVEPDVLPPEANQPARDGTRAAEPPTRDAHHRDELQPITEKQLQRLWVIIRNSGRMESVVKTWLHTKYGIGSSKEIARRDYEAICQAIESPHSLPL